MGIKKIAKMAGIVTGLIGSIPRLTLVTGLIGSISGLTLLICSGTKIPVWGVRGVKDVYEFQYQSKPTSIQRENRILAFDRHYFLLNNRDRLRGTLVADDGTTLTISEDGTSYSIGKWFSKY